MRYSFYFRYPRTKSEMKLYYASVINEVDLPIKVRGKRRPKHLPNAWDDVFRAKHRNWKYYRRNQWRL